MFKEDKEVYARYTEEEKMLIKMTLWVTRKLHSLQKFIKQSLCEFFWFGGTFFSLDQVNDQKKKKRERKICKHILWSYTLGKSGPVKYHTIKTKKIPLKVLVWQYFRILNYLVRKNFDGHKRQESVCF